MRSHATALARGLSALALALLTLAPTAQAAEGGRAREGSRDAAEKVQEGNVKQWIEYYERNRAPRSPAATPPAPPRQPPDAAPGPTR